MECDCCGDEWEEAFFCTVCSRRATEERMGDDEHGGFPMDVCGNCCVCHLIAAGDVKPASVVGLVPLASNDVPF